jgi:hypothetical protein
MCDSREDRLTQGAICVAMNAEIPFFYVVRRDNEHDAVRALRALDAFDRTPGGRIRLDGPDRVVVWRDGGLLYMSPGALSLAGYLDPDPQMSRPELSGPEITPSRRYSGPALIAESTIPAAELPRACELMLGSP